MSRAKKHTIAGAKAKVKALLTAARNLSVDKIETAIYLAYCEVEKVFKVSRKAPNGTGYTASAGVKAIVSEAGLSADSDPTAGTMERYVKAAVKAIEAGFTEKQIGSFSAAVLMASASYFPNVADTDTEKKGDDRNDMALIALESKDKEAIAVITDGRYGKPASRASRNTSSGDDDKEETPEEKQITVDQILHWISMQTAKRDLLKVHNSAARKLDSLVKPAAKKSTRRTGTKG